jgi:hypothetical protein
MTEDQWNDFIKRSKGWFVRMSFELLHSEAYKKLNYGPALKMLNWFYEKIRVEVNKKKRGKDRYRIINDGEIDFTYREAAFRGLTSQKFRKALKDLHGVGFIDIKKPGSALKGDFSVFAFSDRWKAYGTPNFRQVEFPKSIHWVNFGFGSKREKHKKS